MFKIKKCIITGGVALGFSLGAAYASTPYYIQADLTGVSNSTSPWWGLSSNQLSVDSNYFQGYYYANKPAQSFEPVFYQIQTPNGQIGPGVLMLCVAGEHYVNYFADTTEKALCSDPWTGNSSQLNISTSQSSPTFSYSVVAQNTTTNGVATEQMASGNPLFPYVPLIIDGAASDASCQQFINHTGGFTQTFTVPSDEKQTNMVFSANVSVVSYDSSGNTVPAAALSNCSLTPAPVN